MEDLTEDDAGNYEDLIEYYVFSNGDEEEKRELLTTRDYANPALFRKSRARSGQ